MREVLVAALANDRWHAGARSTEARILEFEQRLGIVLPDDFRYLTLHIGGVELHSRVFCNAGPATPSELIHVDLEYFGGWDGGGGIETLYQELLFNNSQRVELVQELVPFAFVPGAGPLCFDFAYSATNPPVVHLTQLPWSSPAPWSPIEYVADSVVAFLELPSGPAGESELPEVCTPSVAALDWTRWFRDRLSSQI